MTIGSSLIQVVIVTVTILSFYNLIILSLTHYNPTLELHSLPSKPSFKKKEKCRILSKILDHHIFSTINLNEQIRFKLMNQVLEHLTFIIQFSSQTLHVVFSTLIVL